MTSNIEHRPRKFAAQVGTVGLNLVLRAACNEVDVTDVILREIEYKEKKEKTKV